jgi:hypothetical protein
VKVGGFSIQRLLDTKYISLLTFFFLQQWDDHPAIMAVGVVDGTSEARHLCLLVPQDLSK